MAANPDDNVTQHPAAAAGKGTPVNVPKSNPDAALDTPELRQTIATEFQRKRELEDERKAINAEIRAVDEGLEARGLNKHALKHLYRHSKMDDADKSGYDRTIVVGRRAVGDPIDTDLFATAPGNAKAH